MPASLAAVRLHPAAPPAPPLVFAARPRPRAWGLALAAHAVLLSLALWAAAPAEVPPPLVRLVFVEPPPPPPPPLGAPGGGGSLAALPAPPAVEEPPRPAPPRRVARPARPAPKARPAPPAPAVARADVRRGSAAGAPGGTANGVPGGVEGGTPGGVVGGRGAGPLPAGQAIRPPLLVSRVTPEYPRAARLRGVEGLVLLEAVLDAEGRVGADVKVLESIPELDEAAVTALRRWRFRPARDQRGRTVPVILQVPVRFVLR